MQAGQAQDSDEGESNSRGGEPELGSEYLFFMDEPVFLDEDDSSAVTTSYGGLAQATTVSPVFGAGENAAPPPTNLSWEPANSLAQLLHEPQTWIELEPVDDDCEQQKLEDIESYLLNSDEEEDEEQNQASAAQPEPLDFIEPIVDVVSVDDDSPETAGAPPEEAPPEPGNEKPSPEAVALQQLENAVAKLDNTTRFSIRDALYRLAENAARRHANPESSDCRLSTHSFETSTNSLDRSIASLLFHKQASNPGAIHQPQQQASSSCVVSSGAPTSHRPKPPSSKARARAPLLHKHPCAGKLSNNNNIPQQQAAGFKVIHYSVTQKPLPVATKRIAASDLGDRKPRGVAVSTTIPRKRIKLNPASSLAV